MIPARVLQSRGWYLALIRGRNLWTHLKTFISSYPYQIRSTFRTAIDTETTALELIKNFIAELLVRGRYSMRLLIAVQFRL
jgi:hypothetical protein